MKKEKFRQMKKQQKLKSRPALLLINHERANKPLGITTTITTEEMMLRVAQLLKVTEESQGGRRILFWKHRRGPALLKSKVGTVPSQGVILKTVKELDLVLPNLRKPMGERKKV